MRSCVTQGSVRSGLSTAGGLGTKRLEAASAAPFEIRTDRPRSARTLERNMRATRDEHLQTPADKTSAATSGTGSLFDASSDIFDRCLVALCRRSPTEW